VWISTPSFTGGYSYLAPSEPILFILKSAKNK
jgi:hypothetical protein